MYRLAGLFAVFVMLFPWNGFGAKFVKPNAVEATLEPVRAGAASSAPEARYYRLICLVHMVGSGKENDPIRPEFVPARAAAAARDGILSWSAQMTDDKSMAIVHVVAASRKALDAIVNDKRAEIRVFEIGKHGKDTIEQEMKKYKKDFDLRKFQVVAH